MKFKRLISLITLATTITLSSQAISGNIYRFKNITLLSNISNEQSNKVDSTTTNSITNNTINLNNVWSQNIGTLKFNPTTNKFEFSEGWAETNPYASKSEEVFAINLYSSTGKLIRSVTVYGGGQYPESEISKAFNNLSYTYGDIIQISYPYSSSKISISNINGKTYNVDKTTSFIIEQDGLKALSSTLHINPIYYTLDSNKVTVSGTTAANTLVNVWIDNKDYTTTSNSDGNFSLDITATNDITSATSVTVVSDRDMQTITPILNPNVYKIQNNTISLNNPWEQNLGTLKFNPTTSKIEYTYGDAETNPYASKTQELFAINLYSSSGQLIKSVDVYGGGQWPENAISEAFNNLSYTYGDIIQISYPYSSSKISISNINGKTYNVDKTTSFIIEQDGLKALSSTLHINPIYYTLDSNKVTVSGTTAANTLVNVWVDNKDYTTTSDSDGNFSLGITATNDITSATSVTVASDRDIQTITPTLNPNIYKIEDNEITLIGNWYGGYYNAAKISFNPITMQLNISGSMNAYFASGSGKAFEISLYSKNGALIKSKIYDNSKQTQDLYNDFNDVSFKYGDIIKVTILGPGKANVSNFDNEKSYSINKSISMKITQDGLKLSNMSQVEVNPFNVLGTSNSKVTTGTLTGTIKALNQLVTILVNGKTFTAKSNANGDFSVNISDPNGFTSTTSIVVETNEQLAKVIYPTANTTLGILSTNITAGSEYGGTSQELSFNPATMQLVNSGSNFAVQLINGTTGDVLSSCAPSNNFTAYTSKNNLNGSNFKYGDIISVYQPQQSYYAAGGNLSLNTTNNKTSINCVNCFKNFEITTNGLVSVPNKNLITSQVLYSGTENMTLTGKTLANTDITISYGDTSKIIKSNDNGKFSLEIPISEAPIGSEVRVFVNNQNNENLVVAYNSKDVNINTNKIEILDNTNIPIFDITFNPLTHELNTTLGATGMIYTGIFFQNELNISLINPKTGTIIKSFTGNDLNNVSNFVSLINNTPYENGDIIKVSYNPSFVKANVYDGKTNIGNSTGEAEYFEITNTGLINLNNKFINVQPLDILNSGKITSTSIDGSATPNTSVNVSVGGKVFTGTTNSNGNFDISITDTNGFTNNTEITVSSSGYIPTIIKPTIENNIKLMDSYINFYSNNGKDANLISSVKFNPETMKFVVNNYSDSFGNGQSHYFDLTLYNNQGKEISSSSINNGATSQLTNLLNGKSFNYGDIIELNYNVDISKPVVLNGNNVLSNITGNKEYFEITRNGLVKVNFGQDTYTSNVYWEGNNLVINSTLANGQSESTLSASKKLVILNSANQIIGSVNTTNLDDNFSSIQGIISKSTLSNLIKGETYTFALDINNKLFPIKVSSNVQSNSNYLLEGNSDNLLSISVKQTPVVTINNSSDISNYLNKVSSNIKTQIPANISNTTMNNSNLNYNVITNEFINRIGETNLENFYNKSEINKEFINWVLNDKTAMEEYIQGTNPGEININGLQIWANIWNTYTNSKSGFNLKLAIATAIANANPIMAWPCSHYYMYGDRVTVGSPIERYNIFETLNSQGGMLPIFKTLNVRHLEYVVNTDIPNSQIMELRSIVLENHNGYMFATNKGLVNVAYTIYYNIHNPHNGQSVDANSDFYGPNPTVADVWYDGGVCFSIAELGAGVCQVFGVPSQAVTQDNGIHKVFIYYNNNGTWDIGNNIFGLSKTFGGDMSGWSNGIATSANTACYTWLYQKADTPALEKSNEYLWLANSGISYQEKMNAINEAISIQPLNLGAWLAKIKLMKTNNNLTAQDYLNLSNEIISTFKDYPMPMFDTLLQIKSEILQKGTTTQYSEFINSIKNALESVTNSQEKPIAQDMLKLMPKEGLVITK